MQADEADDAVFDRRRSLYGGNVFAEAELPSFLRLCLDILGDPMLIVLLIAGVGEHRAGAGGQP